MIKKINKYLKENHPLIWNIRAVWLTGLLLLLNFLFFIIGYFSVNQIVDLQKINLEQSYFSTSWVWIGILFTILIFILWLNQYFKQNAFKSFYPKSNISLVKEFIIILIISFLNISYYISYTEGLRQKISSFKTTQQLLNDLEVFYKVEPFTLQGQHMYDGSRELPVPAFDTLVSRKEVLQLYVEDRVKQGFISDKYLNNIKVYNDSLPVPYYSTEEFDYLLAKKFGRYINTTYNRNNYSNVIPSLYNYNYNYYSYVGYNTKNKKYNKQIHNMLVNEQKDSISYLLEKYLKLADEYQVGYLFKNKPWIDYVYNPPYYFVEGLSLENPYTYNSKMGTIKNDYIAHNEFRKSLQSIYESKESIFHRFEPVLFLLYLALVFTLLIYTFKVTSLRSWVIALVGIIILGFIYSTLFFLLNLFFSFNEEGLALSILYLFLFTFITFTFLGVKQQKGKTITGVNLNWLLWSIPAIIPLIVGTILFYFSITEHNYKLENGNYNYPPIYYFLTNGWVEILLANYIISIISIVLMIPIIKKWKAMPEE